jgi:hypothetical protein
MSQALSDWLAKRDARKDCRKAVRKDCRKAVRKELGWDC